MTKIKNTFSKAKNVGLSLSTMMTTALLASPLAFANADPGKIVGKLIDSIWTIFRYIGILLLAWSVGMLVLAFKNEDADSKSRAMMMLVVSCLLIGLKTIWSTLGISV